MRELADGCCLSHSVHADDHNYVRPDIERHFGLRRHGSLPASSFGLIEDIPELGLNQPLQLVDIVELFSIDLLARLLDYLHRGADADVGADQSFLELIKHRGIDLSTAADNRI